MFALKGFSDSDFDLLRRFLIRIEVERNEVVVKLGDPAQKLFLLEEGAVKIVQRPVQEYGDDVTLGVVKAGGFFGEEALLRENQSYMSTAIAVENSVLMIMDRDGLQKLMAESISVGTKLLLALSKTYREALSTPELMGKILTFYSPKGGTGNTTLAVNTAVLLARTKKRVAFLDCDMQFGNANLFVGAPSNLNIARLVQKEERLVFDRIKGYMTRKFEVDFLFSPDLPQDSELISRTNLNQILRTIGTQYDYIILDTRSEIDDQTLLAWDMADLIVLVSHGDLAGLTRQHRLFRVLSRLNFHKDKFAVLINRFRESQKSFTEEFRKLPVGQICNIAEDSLTVPEAEFAGIPLVDKSPSSPAGKDLAAFVTLLTGEEAASKTQRGGIFSRLRSLFS
ncbi:MAG TPA: cyclic nucleotide-binding domain-containing protein [Candidatus Ozemobacteraceae bacterium]|nr:cyclic nucleotide-binding domain-containing protein [Candidatus Ozemobacteraceae bacterium]